MNATRWPRKISHYRHSTRLGRYVKSPNLIQMWISRRVDTFTFISMIVGIVAVIVAIPAIPAIDRWMDSYRNNDPPRASGPFPTDPNSSSTSLPHGVTTTTRRIPKSASTTGPESRPTLPPGESPIEPPAPPLPVIPQPATPSLPKPGPRILSIVASVILSPHDEAEFITRDVTVNGTAPPPKSPKQLWVIVQDESGRWYLYPTSSLNSRWSAQVLIGPKTSPTRTLPFRLVLVELTSAAQAAVKKAWENTQYYNSNGMAPFSSGVHELNSIRVLRRPA
jgi:hypothetical protein